MSTIMIADNENVICSYKSYQGPSLPPRVGESPPFILQEGKKQQKKKTCKGRA